MGFEPRVFRTRSERDNHYTTGPELKTSGKSVIINLRQSAFFFVLNARGFKGSKEDTETVIKIGQDDIETMFAVGQSGLDLGPTNSPFHPYSKVSKTPDFSLTIHSGHAVGRSS